MQIVEVIPIVKGITKPTLTYFTKKKFALGSFVRIPIRNSKVLGIVSGFEDARSVKTSLKRADFALKKISLAERAGAISGSFIKAASETANFYATTTGNILGRVLPKFILKHPELIGKPFKLKDVGSKEIKLVQLSDNERFREYRGIVRENFAKNSSVLFVIPTRGESLRAEEELSQGINDFVFNTADKSPKKLELMLSKAGNVKHPILLITTPANIVFNRPDLNTIIVERENSGAYRTLTRPFFSIKTFLIYYAKAKGAMLILGDSILSLESLWLEREGVYSELSPITWRLKHESLAEVIDLRANKSFSVFSERLVSIISKALSEDKKVFLFGTRKGLSSTTMCGDCSSLLLCKNCQAPLVLHKEHVGGKPVYACHHCGAKRSSEIRCDNCQSWKLTPLGVGIDRIEDECKGKFPDAEVFVLDKDHASTKARAKHIIKKFFASPRAILIGSELALPFINNIPVVAAVSLDSLFSIPDFHINEKVFYLVTHLRELSTEHFIIQTRNAGTEILEYAAAGNILDFYRNEIKDRKELKYPPFSVFIKVNCEDKEERIEKKAILLQSMFSHHEPHFTLKTGKSKGLRILSMILRLSRSEWPNKVLRDKLLLLTPDFLAKVDPESII